MRKNLRRMLASLALCAVLAGTLTVSASAAAFRDVPTGHWAEKEIQRCVENGFFNGQSETHFGLGQKMSRSAFAVSFRSTACGISPPIQADRAIKPS